MILSLRIYRLLGNILRNPAAFELGVFGQQLENHIFVKRRQRDARSRVIESLDVFLWPKETHSPFGVFVRLHALEAAKGIVEHRGSRVKRQRFVRLNHWSSPSCLVVPFRSENVVYNIDSSEQTDI